MTGKQYAAFRAPVAVLAGLLAGCAPQKAADGALVAFAGSGAQAARAVADLGGYRITYYEAVRTALADGAIDGTAIEESDDPFTIVDAGPRDELPAEIRRPAIYVVFSQPVIPLAQLGEPIRDGSAFMTIDPPLAGVFRWYGSRLLSFESDAGVIPQRRYRVTLSDRLTSLGGKPLTGERSFTFETERLSVLSWRLGPKDVYVNRNDASPEDARVITITFSSPVQLEEISRWFEVHAGDKTWEFSVARPGEPETRWVRGQKTPYDIEQSVVFTLKERLPPDSAAQIVLLAGARSEPDGLGSKTAQSWNFHTIRPFAYRNSSVRSRTSPRTRQSDDIPVYIDFSHGIDPSGAEAYFSIDGRALKADQVRVYGERVALTGLSLEYQRSYTVRIDAALRDVWGRALGKAETVSVHTGDASSYWFTRNTGPRMLEAAFPPKIVWETQNPVTVSSLAAAARSPYEIAQGTPAPVNGELLPRNSKRYFMEDLLPFMGPSGRGTAALRWQYTIETTAGRYTDQAVWLTVQVTDIGITTRYAYNRALVWATRLSSGEPLAGAKVELLNGETVVTEGTTAANGLAAITFPPGYFTRSFSEPRVITWGNKPEFSGFRIRVSTDGGARLGGDQAEFIPNNSHNLWRFSVAGWVSPFNAEAERAVIFLYTDRGIYRPGETVTFRGVDRRLFTGRYQPFRGGYTAELRAAGGEAIAKIEGDATASGGSFGSFTLPGQLDPGPYTIHYERKEALDGNRNWERVDFQVANFERLRTESAVRFPAVTAYAEEPITGTLTASYLAGGALALAPYSWHWTRESVPFVPGGAWEHWQFGPGLTDGRTFLSRGEGNLGMQGDARIGITPQADGIEGAAYRYMLEGSVQDAGRQEISSRGGVVAHPASFYIGLRLDTGNLRTANLEGGRQSAYFLASGSPATASWALVAPGGNAWEAPAAFTGEFSVQLLRHEWKQARQAGVSGRVNLIWERVETLVEERKISPARTGRAARGPVSGVFSFTPGEAGQWEIRMRGVDSRGRAAFTRLSFYVSGSGWVRWGAQDADAITITPDRPRYAPGDTAKLLVQSPLPRGRYLLTIEREGILSERIIELEGSARTIEIPIQESYIPVVYAALSAYTVRAGPPENTYFEPDLDKPRGIFGLAQIAVDTASRQYQVEINPARSVYGPGEEAEVVLRATRNGRPAAGVEISFMAVDRGVVDLINYHVPDPAAYFYNPARFPLAVRGADSRALLIDPVTWALSDLQGGDSEDGSKLEERRDFRPTAVFEPYLVTGADGTARVRFRLPDSLTTYRCTAVAVGEDAFGAAEKDLRVSAPLTAVIAAPRRLRWRDTGQASLLLTNLDNRRVEARVSLAVETVAANGGAETGEGAVLEVDGPAERFFRIEPAVPVEAAFRLAATGTGRARLVFTLHSPAVNERIIREIEVARPGVYETVTLMGNLAGDRPFIEEGIALPGPGTGGTVADTATLAVSVSASRLAQIKDAVMYLLDYPYGCLEQRAARLLPLIAFGDHLAAFDLETPVRDIEAVVAAELEALFKNALVSGAYPYWPGSREPSYFVSVRAGHIIALARAKDLPALRYAQVPPLVSFLASSREAHQARRSDPFLWGYSLWVRAMLGERIGSEVRDFLDRGDEIGIAGFCFAGLAALEMDMRGLAVTARDRARRFIRSGTRSLDITVPGETRSFGTYWGFDTDNYALALMLWQALSPADDMTTRLANALVDRQRRTGVWSNTSATFWAVLAFARVAASEAAETGGPQHISVSLGGKALLSTAFTAYGGQAVRETFPLEQAPVSGLPRNTILPLRFERTAAPEGGGRVYYHASLRYGIPAEIAALRDEGLSVFVETLDGEGNPVTDGRLTAGNVYTRRVIVVSARTRTHVAVRAPVPSGAEIVDASFVTSATVPPSGAEPEEGPFDLRREPPRQFILDGETRFHWDYFPQGRKEAAFRFRAVMPGVYPTPPAEAECMYEPEVFGRSAGELVIIQ
jgi:uncharacterized protein YfaS (alpha-2-macroglobulin family)